MQRSPGLHGARFEGEMETDSRLLLCPECLRSSRSVPIVDDTVHGLVTAIRYTAGQLPTINMGRSFYRETLPEA